jgi:hypothetical protein
MNTSIAQQETEDERLRGVSSYSFLVFFDVLSTLGLPIFFWPWPIGTAPSLFLAKGFFWRTSSPNFTDEILQKSAPKLLITSPDKVGGGSTEQQKQSFLGWLPSTLKPFDFPSNLILLLTSVVTKGVLAPFLHPWRAEVVALDVGTPDESVNTLFKGLPFGEKPEFYPWSSVESSAQTQSSFLLTGHLARITNEIAFSWPFADKIILKPQSLERI